MELRGRTVLGTAVLLLDIAFCIVMYGWQLRYQYAFHSAAGNMVLALPFLGFAFMVFADMRRLAATLGWLVLALLTGAAYVTTARSSSSTAALVFIAPFVYGTVALVVFFALDSFLRGRTGWQRR